MTQQEMRNVSISKVMWNKNKVAFDEIVHSVHQFNRIYYRCWTRPTSGYDGIDCDNAIAYFEEFEALKSMNS